MRRSGSGAGVDGSAGGAGSLPRVALIFDLEQHYHREVLAGVLRYRKERGDLVVLDWAGIPYQSPARLPSLEGDAVLGFVSPAFLRSLPQWRGKPAVTVSNKPDPGDLSVVCSDDRAVGRMAADYLTGLGLRELAVLGWWDGGYTRERADGFSNRAEALGLGCAVFRPDAGTRDVHRVRLLDEEIGAWLTSLPSPCGVYCVDDRFAVDVYKWAARLGRRIPDDWAVLGTDNDHLLLELLDCPLSSVELNGREIGYQAASLLARQCRGEAAVPVRVAVPPLRVVRRASTDLLYNDDPVVRAILGRIASAPGRAWTVAGLVEGLGLSRRAAEQRFRVRTGGGIYDRLIDVRIERAKELLADSTLPVGRISDELGFYDQRQLSHLFKRRTGMTPRDFRRHKGVPGEFR
ncbi:MAG: substrate-binding domain-containing protein [Opitutales bacterium]|nr:substrate-binding domain-containing protein [Opitutales bacterium]